jgi:hypothetical protein
MFNTNLLKIMINNYYYNTKEFKINWQHKLFLNHRIQL